MSNRQKQIYKITYPNGKIYVGMDLTGTTLYFGSPSAGEEIAADHQVDCVNFTFTLRKEILWQSETAADAEVRAKEIELILAAEANNPRNCLIVVAFIERVHSNSVAIFKGALPVAGMALNSSDTAVCYRKLLISIFFTMRIILIFLKARFPGFLRGLSNCIMSTL